ncbi:polyamine-transporting ATPase [Thermobispora bispora]|uniref:ABC transporter ATP-binding protein n=1 Tax=Thermobispora bispora TaxID=2006 RepID=UPI00197E035D|nr:ABC transporter ATP-binding protein [Thermobispora bispora]MBO2475419.1 polyamine ABC transporter ATP-binding protein [Actinomycetales bacterium]MDI9581714.1 ABC transporter ATP-binding protein [Thermobispora sp.]QSI48127.1 ABC transporter ATP-binding protein [Thermobispora bispora]
MTSPTPPSTGASVRLNRVTKRYGGLRALDDVTLHIEAGEFMTLLGASGSGKSTLLNIIAGFTKADSGTVEVGGRDLTRVPPHKRGLGMVFQQYALFPHMTVFENVAFPLRRRRVPKDELVKRVREALDIVELGHLGSRMPAQLSGGQQQRVAFARAIVFHPQVLLMDEPLAALDKRLREQLQIEIKRLHRELGITFVFVTHDQQEALAMSDRIALLRDGRIVQVGTPDELYERPAELYAAEFLGESNIFRGTVRGGVFTDGASGAGLKVAGSPADGPAAIVLRPEKVRILLPPDEVPPGHNALSGVVRELIYLGGERRVEVGLADGRRVIARLRSDDPHGHVPPGTSVIACWRPEDALVLRNGSAAAAAPDPQPVG